MYQKLQRVMQQNSTIQSQVETLQSIMQQQQMDHGHQRHLSGNAAHNHLDTIRKCNLRGIQLLHEIMEKNRRKRGSDYAFDSGMSGSYGGDVQHTKRRSYKMSDRPPSMTIGHNDHSGNSSRTLMNYYDEEEEEYSRHNTKSTRFSSKGVDETRCL